MSYYNISRDEMHKFLTGLEFQPMDLPNTVELVYGKIVNVSNHRLSLRVYTAINPSGESRKKGSDAIRVQLYFMIDGKPLPVGKSQKCLRIGTWQKNLKAAIQRHFSPRNFKICPKCGAPMVERTRRSDQHKFWGCIRWSITQCNGKPDRFGPSLPAKPPSKPIADFGTRRPTTVKVTEEQVTGLARFRIPQELVSKYQQEVRTFFLQTHEHLIIGARAGGGKTAMLRDLSSWRRHSDGNKPIGKFLMLAFGKKNAAEGREKMPRDVDCRTTHGFCNSFLRNSVKLPERPDRSKNRQVMEDVYPLMDRNSKERKRIRKACFRLIGLAKNFACKPGDEASVRAVMDQYAFDLEGEAEHMTVVEVVSEVLSLSVPGEKFGGIYDFDDMLWWVIVLDIRPPRYDVVLADECQDFNACQIELLRRMVNNGTRIVAVGDPHQAVYRFRGADCDAYERVKMMLQAEKTGCTEIKLPINYRCGRAILAHVRENTHVKDIEAAPNAIEGEVVESMTYPDV